MNKKLIFPDFTRSNLNISATLAEFLGAPNKNVTLPIIESELEKNYKNIVFICFDGLGIYPINKNLEENSILRKNIKQTLLSTFPSTTTNATTSLLQNELPLEHGWFGWSVYHKELHKNIDIFLNTDSATGEHVEIKNSPLGKLNYYFDNANSDYEINTVFPKYVKVAHPERNYIFNNQDEFFLKIQNICNKLGNQFIYAYFPEPDYTMHDYGVSSNEAKKLINSISNQLEELYKISTSTLFIITADHGQTDVTGYIPLFKDEKLMEMLEIYPFLDARSPAFLVKEPYKKEFENYFNKTYGNDFILFKSSELIEKGVFGNHGDKAHLLGDYIAICTTHKIALLTPKSHKFKGHHTSLTEEMEVPLIILAKQ